MPRPICVQCKTSDTLIWRSVENGKICIECDMINNAKDIEPSGSKDDDRRIDGHRTIGGICGMIRSRGGSTRSSYTHPGMQPNPTVPHGRGRRSIFDRQPLSTATSTVKTSNWTIFRGLYMGRGDIVSMVGFDDGTYYAQIRAFLRNENSEKCAFVSWLLPTRASPPPEQGFDPATYIMGPEEAYPQKLQNMKFVMRTPAEFSDDYNLLASG